MSYELQVNLVELAALEFLAKRKYKRNAGRQRTVKHESRYKERKSSTKLLPQRFTMSYELQVNLIELAALEF